MQEIPILEAPATVLHLIQNAMILVSFTLSIRWGWRELRIRRNGNGKRRRAVDTLPGLEHDNPSPEYHELKEDIKELRTDLKEHKQWTRRRDEHHTGVVAAVGQRIAKIEGRLAKE